jgi:tryptophanase
MPTTPDSDDLLRRLHDVYHASADRPVHQSPGGHNLFVDTQPGTPGFAQRHLVGGAAPEPIIERLGGIGAEDFGPVELIDGRTGQSIARINRHMRRRLER